jgi:predicted transcriptional regulator
MPVDFTIPYVVGQWVRGERFYGRESVISEILEGPRSSMWLLGTRRLGKTSLLKQLEWLTAGSAELGYLPVFWDFQGSEDAAELHLGFRDALLDAEERLTEHGIELAEVEAPDLFASLGRLRRRLRGAGQRLLLLCDEVEELIKLHGKDPSLLRKLRRALQSGEEIRVVLTSTIRLWALAQERGDTSPFLHGFTPPVYLGMLTDAAARALLRQSRLPEARRPQVSESVVEAIRERCDNHPYLLQLVGKRYVETGDLDEAVESVAADEMVSHFFSVDWAMLTFEEQAILRLLRQRSAASSDTLGQAASLDTSRLSGSLLRLENLGLIRRNEERQFILGNHFFQRWLSADDLTLEPWLDGPLAKIDERYELLRQVGAGGVGFVYEAWDGLLETKIAIKLLRPEYAENEDVLERFRQEIVLSRDLSHPNILRAYHLGEYRGRRYLTMQWVDGPTLAERIAHDGPLAQDEVLGIGAKLAGALASAHARRVLHRDIKPQNVLLEGGREPLITDFGLARVVGGPGITSVGMFVGTPNYVSPEQANMLPLDERSDVYALGIVLFEMATGRRPFDGESIQDILEMHRNEPAPDPRLFRPELTERLAALILRCLEKEPDRRFPDAVSLRQALQDLTPPDS